MVKDDAREDLLQCVKQIIARYTLVKPEEPILVALSGGLDSMVLLYALKDLGFEVQAAHFDHQTRSGQSANDADFVRRVCADGGIPCHFGTEPVAENARCSGRSFEAYARERRYAFLTCTARQLGGMTVATGHQQDDQVETILMGVLGLASDISPAGFAPAVEMNGVRIVRPLIDCERDKMQAWAVARGISWCEDSTNATPLYRRNRVRLNLMPLLEKQSREHLVRFSEIVRSDTFFLDAYAASMLEKALHTSEYASEVSVIDTRLFQGFPEAVRRHAVKVLAHRLGVPSSFNQCLRIEYFMLQAGVGDYTDFGGGVRLYQGRDGTHILEHGCEGLRVPVTPTILEIPGTTHAGAYTIETRRLEASDLPVEDLKTASSPWCQYFDWNALPKPLCVRSRKPGDTLTPFGFGKKKKVQEVLAENGVPSYLRDGVPIITAREIIIWVVGCRRSNAAPLGNKTEPILEIKCWRG